MDEIDNWSHGKRSMVGEAIDKAKDLWKRASGHRAVDMND